MRRRRARGARLSDDAEPWSDPYFPAHVSRITLVASNSLKLLLTTTYYYLLLLTTTYYYLLLLTTTYYYLPLLTTTY